MENLNSFIITLATVIIFISAMELILPDNSFKKYQSFVLGLIVLSVILTPIVSFFTDSENLGDKVKVAIENMENNAEAESSKNVSNNKDYVIKTLENNCERELSSKYKDKAFTVDVEGDIDFTNYKTSIESVIVKIRDKGEFEEIIVGNEKDLETRETVFSKEVKGFLSEQFKIEEQNIIIIEK